MTDVFPVASAVHVIRYINDDILMNLDGVLENLAERLSSGSTSLTPPYEAEGLKS